MLFRSLSETGELPSAQVTIRVDQDELKATATGGGVVDATFKAIEAVLNTQAHLQLYSVNNITTGTDAQGEVTVEVEHGGQVYRGRGVSTDSVEASVLAFLNAINRVAATAGRPAQRVSPHEAKAIAADAIPRT